MRFDAQEAREITVDCCICDLKKTSTTHAGGAPAVVNSKSGFQSETIADLSVTSCVVWWRVARRVLFCAFGALVCLCFGFCVVFSLLLSRFVPTFPVALLVFSIAFLLASFSMSLSGFFNICRCLFPRN